MAAAAANESAAMSAANNVNNNSSSSSGATNSANNNSGSNNSTNGSMSSSLEDSIPKGLVVWRDAVSKAATSAQLAMALYMLESSIAWDKSIMKAVSRRAWTRARSSTLVASAAAATSHTSVGIKNHGTDRFAFLLSLKPRSSFITL